jgi:hypothetical protein
MKPGAGNAGRHLHLKFDGDAEEAWKRSKVKCATWRTSAGHPISIFPRPAVAAVSSSHTPPAAPRSGSRDSFQRLQPPIYCDTAQPARAARRDESQALLPEPLDELAALDRQGATVGVGDDSAGGTIPDEVKQERELGWSNGLGSLLGRGPYTEQLRCGSKIGTSINNTC